MKKVCDVGRWKPKEQSASPSIPHEIIVDILSRLPVKDLLRFRVVCKHWEATISDPGFAEIHLQQQYKNASSQNLIAWEYRTVFAGVYFANGLHVAELQNNCIEFVSEIEYGLGCDTFTLCSCDGLYLRYFCQYFNQLYFPEVKRSKCVLWNPSRRTYRELNCPVPLDNFKTTTPFQGMYYDPLLKDYKIVIGDKEHYAVYSCRDNKWGDVKEMTRFLGNVRCDQGVFINGSLYWLVKEIIGDKCAYIRNLF